MRISGLTHAAFAPALLRFAIRVATHAQGWLPAGWLAFTGRASNPLDHYERFQFTWSSPFPVLLTLLTLPYVALSSYWNDDGENGPPCIPEAAMLVAGLTCNAGGLTVSVAVRVWVPWSPGELANVMVVGP